MAVAPLNRRRSSSENWTRAIRASSLYAAGLLGSAFHGWG